MPTVLIVEDCRDLDEELADSLRDGGWDSVVVASLEEALSVVAQVRFQVVLVDEVLRDGTAAMLEAALKADPRVETLSFICMTNTEDSTNHPPERFALARPFVSRDVLRALEEALRARSVG